MRICQAPGTYCLTAAAEAQSSTGIAMMGSDDECTCRFLGYSDSDDSSSDSENIAPATFRVSGKQPEIARAELSLLRCKLVKKTRDAMCSLQ